MEKDLKKSADSAAESKTETKADKTKTPKSKKSSDKSTTTTKTTKSIAKSSDTQDKKSKKAKLAKAESVKSASTEAKSILAEAKPSPNKNDKKDTKRKSRAKSTDDIDDSAAVTAELTAFRPKRDHYHIPLYIMICIAMGCSVFSATYCLFDLFENDTPITVNYPGTDSNSANFTEGSIADVVSKVAPGVVSIVTEIRSTGFFGQSYTSNAAGTGMIVSGDGYILTNKHVIEGANAVQVVLDDGSTYSDVEIIGADPLNDVAFLKIKNVENLPTVKLGDSKTVTAGQQVIAIGNALGQYQNTVTSGVISGTGRSLTATSSDYSTSETLTDMIQTDAAINSGNSGGPLVNAAGEVIGINTATSAEADGIGFAIPISSVKGQLNNIIQNGKADRAYIGVYYVTITPDVATAYDLPVTSGAYLYSASQYSAIVADGPGAKAGLKEKDIITKINGISLGQAGSVSSIIGEYKPGDTIQLTILRDGKEKTLKLTLGSYSK